MTDNQNPEQKARDVIDAQLRQAGWRVQHAKKIDLNDGPGQAVGESINRPAGGLSKMHQLFGARMDGLLDE